MNIRTGANPQVHRFQPSTQAKASEVSPEPSAPTESFMPTDSKTDWKSLKDNLYIGANVVGGAAVMGAIGAGVLGVFGNGLGLPVAGAVVGGILGGGFGAVVGSFSAFDT